MSAKNQEKQGKNKKRVPPTTFADRPQDINRKGRPKKEHALTDLLREALDQPRDKEGKTNKQIVIETMLDMAIKGDAIILKYVFDRIDGKPMQQIQADINADFDTSFEIVKKNADT